jgi:hypothetical protein
LGVPPGDRPRIATVAGLALAAGVAASLDLEIPIARALLGSLLLLALPGWAVLAANGSPPRGLDGLLISLGLSLVISTLVCAALALSGIGPGRAPVSVALAALTLVCCLRGHRRAAAAAEDRPSLERWPAALEAAAVTLVFVAAAVVVGQVDARVTDRVTAASVLPAGPGSAEVRVVRGSGAEPVGVRVLVDGEEVIDEPALELAPGGETELSVPRTGELVARVYPTSSPDSTLREVRLAAP